MESVTIILNDEPYGTEKVWNGLRLAESLQSVRTAVNIFLLGNSVSSAKKGQRVPTGYYNLGEMLQGIISKGAIVKVCATCLKARGLKQEELIEGVEIGGMLDLAKWCKESAQVITF